MLFVVVPAAGQVRGIGSKDDKSTVIGDLSQSGIAIGRFTGRTDRNKAVFSGIPVMTDELHLSAERRTDEIGGIALKQDIAAVAGNIGVVVASVTLNAGFALADQ